MHRKTSLAAAGAALFSLLVGCAGGPDAQLSSCQQDKEQLLATIRQQRDSNRLMHEQVASLETRLDQAEKELARRMPGGTRLSAKDVKTAPLPWRSPDQSTAKNDRAARPPAGNQMTAKRAASLTQLVNRHEHLELDPQTGAAKVAADISFEEGSAQLTAAGREQLDKLAKLLKSDEAADLRVMVSGHAVGRPGNQGSGDAARFSSARQLAAARAQAVADYLDSHGIAEQRLGVSGTGSPGTRGAPAGERLAGGVEIHLLPPDAPVLGWRTDTLRR